MNRTPWSYTGDLWSELQACFKVALQTYNNHILPHNAQNGSLACDLTFPELEQRVQWGFHDQIWKKETLKCMFIILLTFVQDIISWSTSDFSSDNFFSSSKKFICHWCIRSRTTRGSTFRTQKSNRFNAHCIMEFYKAWYRAVTVCTTRHSFPFEHVWMGEAWCRNNWILTVSSM